jgi:hypothetical protein
MARTEFSGDPPRIANLYLRHLAYGDACEALISETVRADLSTVVQYYERVYGRIEPITLRVWNYEQDDYIDVLYDPTG